MGEPRGVLVGGIVRTSVATGTKPAARSVDGASPFLSSTYIGRLLPLARVYGKRGRGVRGVRAKVGDSGTEVGVRLGFGVVVGWGEGRGKRG